MASPNALKIDAMSLIFAAASGDQELADGIVARHGDDPDRIVKATAAVGAILAEGGKGGKAVIDFIALLQDRLNGKDKAA